MVRFIFCTILGLLFGVGDLSTPARAQIGVASVVKNEVNGSVGGRTRILQVGTSIFRNEVITTGGDSSAQLLFRDETSLTLGANAKLTLDRFVYDPNAKSGDIAVSIAQGAFRFVTGSADPRSYKIRTPVATVGVRGTIVEGYLSAITGILVIVVVEGSVEVQLANGTIVTLTAGQSLAINSSGTVISGPATWTGPTLDLGAGIRFVFDDQGRLLNEGGDPLPGWNDFNDALDSRNINIDFPPPGGGGGGAAPIKAPPPPSEGFSPQLNQLQQFDSRTQKTVPVER